MKIALFGGSFDPVHTEHIRLVESAIQSLQLDKLFIMPACKPPHKPGKELTDDKHRLETCRLAFAKIEKAEVCDYEMQKGGVSYTYETCEHFKKLYPTAKLYFLVGTDMLRDFPTWKNTQSILQNATLAVCARNEKESWLESERADFYRRFKTNFEVIAYNGKDISSTRLRVLLGAGESVGVFVPAPVLSYIKSHKLYEIENADKALKLLTEKRKIHSLKVAEMAAKKAVQIRLSERKAITASLFHDCAKYIDETDERLQGFRLPTEFGKVPKSVWHQFAGAYLAEHYFGVKDEEILNAIKYHTSGKENMTPLEKLLFLADTLEESRTFDGVEYLRELFWKDKGENALDKCLEETLACTLKHFKTTGAEIYPLTQKAYEYIKKVGKL